MAAVDVRTMVGSPERQKKVIHPFFGKPQRIHATPHPEEPSPQPTETTSNDLDTAISIQDDHELTAGNVAFNGAKAEAGGPTALQMPLSTGMEVDMNESRRKRRRTTPTKSKVEHTCIGSHPNSSQDSALDYTPVKTRVSSRVDDEPSVQQLTPIASNTTAQIPGAEFDTEVQSLGPQGGTVKEMDKIGDATEKRQLAQKPKKMLHFNIKSGTIGSPPSKKKSKFVEKKVAPTGAVQTDDDAPKKARRSRKKVKSLPVCLSYGTTEEKRIRVGFAIDAIREGTMKVKVPTFPDMIATKKKRVTKADKPATPSKAVKSTTVEQHPKVESISNSSPACETTASNNNAVTMKPVAKPATTTPHPFFLGKAAIKAVPKEHDIAPIKPSSASISRQATPPTIAPKKLIRAGPQGTFAATAVSSFPAFITTAKMQKVPGALEPAWPWHGMAHVRGQLEDVPVPQHDDAPTPFTAPRMRKSKYASTMLSPEEDILHNIISTLNLQALREDLEKVDPNQHTPADKHLRLPRRHFESGPKLQRRIAPQIKASVSGGTRVDDSEDELAAQDPGSSPHYAISNLYAKVPRTLSAFDKGESPTQTWAQKYAPVSAREVLQSGPEAQILKDWLQTLTVAAVDSGTGRKGSPPRMKAEPPKKKRKSKKLEGFVISDDEEDNEMEEVSLLEDSPPGSQGGSKTLIRRGDAWSKGAKEGVKLQNAVVVSGPNGCGKTAAIYAVAKELDFEIFEINSSTRRSGKDILEKVGDMTRNHLVQHKKKPSDGAEDDLLRASEAFDADLKSGRQKTVMSFFDKTPAPQTKVPKPKKPSLKGEKVAKQEPAKSKVQQKQSLILIEEVDVLFEEDKEFWKTILELMKDSKRPIIMTCNDESLVFAKDRPLGLHAVIRFTPPPLDLAVDYLLLVAANEGHAMHRHSVVQLYEERKHDLRSSITELEFWCQFGVGDRRGGFDWFIPRWPKGLDLDAHGRKLRVVSEGTYRSGMGMLGHDYLCSTNNITSPEEEMLKEAWDGWQVDAGDWHDSLKLDHWSSQAKVPSGKEHALGALAAYEDFTDSISAADLCSHGWYGTGLQEALDTTSPPTFPKALEDNVLGLRFVKADTAHPQVTLERDIAISIKCLARDAAQKHAAQFPKVSSVSLKPITEKQVDHYITKSVNKPQEGITRRDFFCFDPIGDINTFVVPGNYIQASILDSTTTVVSEDVAPYIRSIVAYDAKLADERKKLSNLLSEGGRPGKRMRTTRAAMSALEGGERKSTRRERWFGDKVNSIDVRRTGTPEWEKALAQEMQVRKEQAARDKEEAGVKIAKA